MKFKNNRENGGFTLIEVILSMAILALISLPLLGYFTDSIRYSQLMKQKQLATVMAQETVEMLKAEEVLIDTLEDGTTYSVPCLLGPNGNLGEDEEPDPNHFTVVSGGFNSEGRGSMVLKKTTENHDIVVSMDTNSAANNIERPIVYSIDDAKDVLAVERDQYSEAIIYFMAVNSAYVSAKNAGISSDEVGEVPPEGGGATPILSVMDRDEIEENTTREMFITINYDGGYYLVSGNYVYTCTDVEGAGSVATFTSSPLLDVKTADLRSIYLLYDIMHEEPSSSPITNKTPKRDFLNITNNSSILPNIIVVCQNVDVSNLNTYYFQILCDKDQGLDSTTVRTNLNTSNIINSFGMPGSSDKVTNLSEEGYPVRIINLEVAVYPAGGFSTDAANCEEPYTVFTSTKGE